MKLKIASLLLLASLSFLTACVSRLPDTVVWPKDIPSREFFVAQYEADSLNKKTQDLQEYLLWVLRFYKGWELYSNGWSKVTEDSLHGVTDAALAQEIKADMDQIGVGIACEWAKNKKDRRVLTRHVVVWGNALIESMRRGQAQEIVLVRRVLADLNGLLDTQVDLDEIKPERYFPRDNDDVFK